MFAGPERREIQWKGEYREIVEPKLLVLTFSDRPDEVYELVTVVLVDLDDGSTEMIFRQRGHLDFSGLRAVGKGVDIVLGPDAERLA